MCFTYAFSTIITRKSAGVLKLSTFTFFGIGSWILLPIRKVPGGRNLLSKRNKTKRKNVKAW